MDYRVYLRRKVHKHFDFTHDKVSCYVNMLGGYIEISAPIGFLPINKVKSCAKLLGDNWEYQAHKGYSSIEFTYYFIFCKDILSAERSYYLKQLLSK